MSKPTHNRSLDLPALGETVLIRPIAGSQVPRDRGALQFLPPGGQICPMSSHWGAMLQHGAIEFPQVLPPWGEEVVVSAVGKGELLVKADDAEIRVPPVRTVMRWSPVLRDLLLANQIHFPEPLPEPEPAKKE